MTIDALRVTTKISGKTRRKRKQKGAGAPILSVCDAIPGGGFGTKNTQTYDRR
jgi:hypothetical protein